MLSFLFNLFCVGTFATFGITCSLINKLCCKRCGTRFPAIENGPCTSRKQPAEKSSIYSNTCGKHTRKSRSSDKFPCSVPNLKDFDCNSNLSCPSKNTSSTTGKSDSLSRKCCGTKNTNIMCKPSPNVACCKAGQIGNDSTSTSFSELSKESNPMTVNIDSCYILEPKFCPNCKTKAVFNNITKSISCKCGKIGNNEDDTNSDVCSFLQNDSDVDCFEFLNISDASNDINRFLTQDSLESDETILRDSNYGGPPALGASCTSIPVSFCTNKSSLRSIKSSKSAECSVHFIDNTLPTSPCKPGNCCSFRPCYCKLNKTKSQTSLKCIKTTSSRSLPSLKTTKACCSKTCQKDCAVECICTQTSQSDFTSSSCQSSCQTESNTKCKCCQTSATCVRITCKDACCGHPPEATNKNENLRSCKCQTDCYPKCNCISSKCQTECCTKCSCTQTKRAQKCPQSRLCCKKCQTECCTKCNSCQTTYKCCGKCAATNTEIMPCPGNSDTCNEDCQCSSSCDCDEETSAQLLSYLNETGFCSNLCQTECCRKRACSQTKKCMKLEISCRECQTECCTKCSNAQTTKLCSEICQTDCRSKCICTQAAVLYCQGCQTECYTKCRCSQTKGFTCMKKVRSQSTMMLKRKRVLRRCSSICSVPTQDTVSVQGNFQINETARGPLKYNFVTQESDNLVRVHKLCVNIRKCGCQTGNSLGNTPTKCSLKLKVNS